MIARMTMTSAAPIIGIVMMAMALVGSLFSAEAQTMQGVPNAMQGFSQNRDKPVNIEAQSLEVRDKDKRAVFSGDVKVVQGDTVMRSKSLVVFYDQDSGSRGMKATTPGPGGSSRIRRLEALGGVIVTQNDQTVTGATAVYDMKSNMVTMEGGVLLTQGKNVLRGERLTVDLTTSVSKVEAGKSTGGRVQGVFQSGGASPLSGLGPKGAKSHPAPQAGKPLRLNQFPPNLASHG